MSNDPKPDWQPPIHDESGVARDGGKSGLPLNHRLRAEALVGLGKTRDPEGLIADGLIAATAKRLQAEAAAASPDPKQPAPPAPPKGPAAAGEKGE